MTGDQQNVKKDLHNLEKVRAIFTSLSKYINAKTIYTSNNPNVSNFAKAYHEAFQAFFKDEKELLLTIEQYQIKWRDEVVYDNDRKTESIAFLLYKDGVGEIIFHSSVKHTELEQFVDLIKNEIYNPSTHLDVVGRLWQAEFTNIFYRVFDECADGAAGEGKGSGSEGREQPLLVNDHPDLPGVDNNNVSDIDKSGGSLNSLDAYFDGILESVHPHSDAGQKEQHMQDILESFFRVSTQEMEAWQAEFAAVNERNKLLWLLDIMLDFTQTRSTPSVVRDILDIIERLVHYVKEEADIPTLIALLEIQKKMAGSGSLAVDFQSLPNRLRDELTSVPFLISLGKVTNRSRSDVHELLQYFRLIGKDSVPGLRELLANSKDSAIHKEACDILIAIAGDDIIQIIDDLNLDNPHEAKDAIHLLQRCMTNEVPPVIRKLIASPVAQVREQVIEYLVQVGNEEAVLLLSQLLEDKDASIRIKTLAAVENCRNEMIIDKVTALCFSEDISTKGTDELERMFRTVGKLAGGKVLDSIKQMIKKKIWFPFGKTQGKQNKLLAISALRHIPGTESLRLLEDLANDSDSLVRTKAQYMLRQLEETEGACEEEQPAVISEETD